MADDPQTLAQRVRAKFPGAYDDLSDQDLEAKVKAKYPGVYDDLPTTRPQTPAERIQSVPSASDKAILTSPNLPYLTGGLAGLATGGLMAPVVAGATGTLTRAAQGGTPAENFAAGAANVAAEIPGAALARYGEPAAARLMQSAVKMPGTPGVLRSIKQGIPVPPVVQTLLDEGINVSHAGIAKLQGLFGAANDAVKSAMDPLTGSISKNSVIAHTLPTAYRMAKRGPDAIEAFNGVIQKFLDNPVFKGDLSPQELQGMKTEGYRGIDYGKMGSDVVESTKSLLHGMKDELENIANTQGTPNLQALNARVGKISEGLDAVAKRVYATGNQNVMGIIPALAHAKTAFMIGMIEKSPALKSMLARGLYQNAARVAGVSPTVLRNLMAGIATTPDDTPPTGAAGQ